MTGNYGNEKGGVKKKEERKKKREREEKERERKASVEIDVASEAADMVFFLFSQIFFVSFFPHGCSAFTAHFFSKQ